MWFAGIHLNINNNKNYIIVINVIFQSLEQCQLALELIGSCKINLHYLSDIMCETSMETEESRHTEQLSIQSKIPSEVELAKLTHKITQAFKENQVDYLVIYTINIK